MSIRCIIFSFIISICYTVSGQNTYKWATEPRIYAASNMNFIGVLNSGTFVTQSKIDLSISLSDSEGQDWQNFGPLQNQYLDISNFLDSGSNDTLYYTNASTDFYIIDKNLGKTYLGYKSKKSFSDAIMTSQGNPVLLVRDSIFLLNKKAQVLKTIKNTFGDYLMGFPIDSGKFLINLSCVDLIKSKCKEKNEHF